MKQSDMDMHGEGPTIDESLNRLALEVGVELEAGQRDQLLRHLTLVLRVNEHLNLTAITDPREAVRLHCADSLTAVPLLEGDAPGELCDIGSGGGFPGIPIAVATKHKVVLLDSTRKKIEFLESVIGELQLGERVEAVHARAEEHALVRAQCYDWVTARAVTSLGSLLELSSPLLRIGGGLIAMKGLPDREELRTADAVANLCGMELSEVVRKSLPLGEERRTILVYRKVGRPRIQLPRRPGMAQRRPLP